MASSERQAGPSREACASVSVFPQLPPLRAAPDNYIRVVHSLQVCSTPAWWLLRNAAPADSLAVLHSEWLPGRLALRSTSAFGGVGPGPVARDTAHAAIVCTDINIPSIHSNSNGGAHRPLVCMLIQAFGLVGPGNGPTRHLGHQQPRIPSYVRQGWAFTGLLARGQITESRAAPGPNQRNVPCWASSRLSPVPRRNIPLCGAAQHGTDER